MKGLSSEILQIIDKMFYNCEKINYYTVCKKAQVSRQTLYNNAEISSKISYYRKFNNLTIDKRISLLKEENNKTQLILQNYENILIDLVCNVCK